MKVMTIFGTRGELVKLSLVTRALDQHCEHITVHTGEETDENLSNIFFRDLEIREPDIRLQPTENIEDLHSKIEELVKLHLPDRVLVVGNTHSSSASLAAANRSIPVYHFEAGSRYSEPNNAINELRRPIDQAASVLMPFTSHCKENLTREGIEQERIFVTGSPTFEVLETFSAKIDASEVLTGLGVMPFQYFVAEIHDAENIDKKSDFVKLFLGLAAVATKFSKQIIFVAHPKSAEKIQLFGIKASDDIRLLRTLSYFDFIALVKNSLAVLTDSGTVQDECAVLDVPSITLRKATDRPETIECGSNTLSDIESESLLRSVAVAVGQPAMWRAPADHLRMNVSHIVSKIVLGAGGSHA